MEVTFEQSFILSNGEQKYKPTDCEQLAELFYNTVHSTNAKKLYRRTFKCLVNKRSGLFLSKA